MSTSKCRNGRLCNRIIRNIALSIIAEKNDLFANYADYNLINNVIGINLYIGNNSYNSKMIVHDEDYNKLLDKKITCNLDFTWDFFQKYDISNKVFDFLRSEKIKNSIIKKNPFNSRYNNNNDLFIHIRLGDVPRFSPGISYFISCIKSIHHDNLFIGTDTVNHKNIKKLKYLFPYLKIVEKKDFKTIQFGSTCKKIVLSHGTFSAVTGYIGFFSDVYYPGWKPIKNWCPYNLFLNKQWTPIIHLKRNQMYKELVKKVQNKS